MSGTRPPLNTRWYAYLLPNVTICYWPLTLPPGTAPTTTSSVGIEALAHIMIPAQSIFFFVQTLARRYGVERSGWMALGSRMAWDGSTASSDEGADGLAILRRTSSHIQVARHEQWSHYIYAIESNAQPMGALGHDRSILRINNEVIITCLDEEGAEALFDLTSIGCLNHISRARPQLSLTSAQFPPPSPAAQTCS